MGGQIESEVAQIRFKGPPSIEIAFGLDRFACLNCVSGVDGWLIQIIGGGGSASGHHKKVTYHPHQPGLVQRMHECTLNIEDASSAELIDLNSCRQI